MCPIYEVALLRYRSLSHPKWVMVQSDYSWGSCLISWQHPAFLSLGEAGHEKAHPDNVTRFVHDPVRISR